MKQPKKLTREQKKLLTKKGMNAKEYMMVAESNLILIIIEKKTGKLLTIGKDSDA